MSTTVGELNIKLNLELARLDAQIKQGNQKIATMGKRMNSDIAKAARAINTTLGALGLGAGVGALAAFGKEIIALGSKINDLSIQAGIGTDAFQTLAAVGRESGVSGEQIASAFTKMAQTIQEAADGSRSAADALAKLKLTATGLKSLKPEEQFALIATQIANAEDKSSAFQSALDILGSRNAPKLREVLRRLGTEGFGALAEATEKVRFSEEQIKTLDDAGDALQRIADTMKVIAAKALLKVVASVDPDATQGVNASGVYNPAVGIGGRSATQQRNLHGAYGYDSNASGRGFSIESIRAQNEANILKERAAKADREAAEAAARFAEETENLAQIQEMANAAGEALLFENQKRNEMIAEGAKLYEATLTPLEKYEKLMAQINELEEQGVVTGYEAARIRAGIVSDFEDGAKSAAAVRFDIGEYEAPEDLAKDWTVFQKQMFEIFNSVGDRAAATFADMVIDGENAFKSLATVAAKAMLEMAARLAVINPLLNMVFGLGGTSAALPTIMSAFGGARAGGGMVDSGKGYIVGERGPEWFSPRTSGTIIPNHMLAGAGGNSTEVTSITYNIQAGVSRAELIPILKQHAEITIAEGRRRERLRK